MNGSGFATGYAATAPKAFKSGVERIHVLIRSLDSVQNGELSLPIGTRLPFRFSTACIWTYEDTFLDYAR